MRTNCGVKGVRQICGGAGERARGRVGERAWVGGRGKLSPTAAPAANRRLCALVPCSTRCAPHLVPPPIFFQYLPGPRRAHGLLARPPLSWQHQGAWTTGNRLGGGQGQA